MWLSLLDLPRKELFCTRYHLVIAEAPKRGFSTLKLGVHGICVCLDHEACLSLILIVPQKEVETNYFVCGTW